MFKCRDCGHIFENPRLKKIDDEWWSVCPDCASSEIDKVQRCWLCGVWAKIDRYDICPACKRASVRKLWTFLNDLDQTEVEYLDWLIDGVSLSDVKTERFPL